MNSTDPRRSDRIQRYVPLVKNGEDLTPDYMNIMGMVFSMCGLMMRMKWCAWVALCCSCVSFANTQTMDDNKQVFSSFMLSFSALIMSYMQNPTPMIPPWASASD
ncbi:unnamed protein product [Ceutorhynchus assimilis]|uniref:Protein Asterix n=1 Tax=Ceutorhynchus assimilis TaxID=467358 RepID=A0A9N9MXS6_9CUCU|nr:unnamed protein product [Ceutorhynchus assimilis]